MTAGAGVRQKSFEARLGVCTVQNGDLSLVEERNIVVILRLESDSLEGDILVGSTASRYRLALRR